MWKLYPLPQWLRCLRDTRLMATTSSKSGQLVAEINIQPPVNDRAAARQRQLRRVRIVTAAAFLVLVGAWFYGYSQSSSDLLPLIPNVLPGATRVELQGGVYAGYTGSPEPNMLVGYAGTSESIGYAGPIELLVGVDPAGSIIGLEVIEHRETPSFFQLLGEQQFFQQMLGLDYSTPMRIGQDLDGVGGATISAEAVAAAVREQARSLASGSIGATLPPANEPVKFGAPEVLLIGLFAAGYFGHRSRNRNAKLWIRRISLFAGAIGLGFVFNKPLTIANFISLISGYWPDWHSNLYWFLLLGGILFVTSAQGKNPYCSWFCPFGAIQEGLARIGGAKLYRPREWHSRLQWLQRGLAFGAITLGLAFRQPGAVSYEPFGTLFDFTGSTPQWILLALIVLASLVVARPFCNYLCPLSPIVDYIGEVRRWVSNIVERVRR